MSQVIQVYLDSDLRAGHLGLSKIAKESGHLVNELSPGQFLVFINRKRTGMKVYAAHKIVAYLQAEKGEVIDLRTVQYIPRAFKSGQVQYGTLVKKVVLNQLTPNGVKPTPKHYPQSINQ